ncbi:MAG: hypothetical protein ACTSV5_05795 [Promethearchaeota archaeon]
MLLFYDIVVSQVDPKGNFIMDFFFDLLTVLFKTHGLNLSDLFFLRSFFSHLWQEIFSISMINGLFFSWLLHLIWNVLLLVDDFLIIHPHV